jgi:hypothetical protein
MRQDTIADRETDRSAVAWMHTIRRNSFVVNPGVDQAMVDAIESGQSGTATRTPPSRSITVFINHADG